MKAAIEVGYDDRVGTISPLLYGGGFEHLAGAVSLGLDAEMLEGRSFQEDDVNEDGVSDKWRPVGRDGRAVQYRLDGDNAFHGKHSQKIEVVAHEGGEAGIEQRGKYIEEGRTYIASLYLRQEGPGRDGSVRVCLTSGAKVCAEAVVDGVSSDWKKHTVSLTSDTTTAEASLQIVLAGRGALWVDQVSLVPEHSWRRHGTRPDIMEEIVDLGPTLIRWPGGWFAEAYRWKDGIGDPDRRPVTRKYHSSVRVKSNPSWEANSFGTDEFIRFCRDIGADPVLTVNSAYEEGVDLEERIAEAAEWVEYCNGAATSEFGALRAANGHPAPYGVRYWGIGNEPWKMDPEEYARKVVRFARRMKEKDPTIKVIAAGGNGYDRDWNQAVIETAGGHFDYLDVHYYCSRNDYFEAMAEPLNYAEFLEELSGAMPPSPSSGKAKVSVLEWNSNSTWIDASKLKEGLYAASFLNGLERLGDEVAHAIPWPLLRRVQPPGNHASDHGLVWYDNHRTYLSPTALAFRLYRRHYAAERLRCDVRCGSFDVPGRSDVPYLDAVATRDEAGAALILKVVNKDPANAIEASVVTKGAPAGGGRVDMQVSTLTGPGVDARNDLCEPETVKIVETTLHDAPDDFTYAFPPHSATVIRIPYGAPGETSA